MQPIPALRTVRFSGRFAAAGYLIGIAMGGFFDGILLHQILQWHHLLSLVSHPAIQDIRVQILADGAFHLLMYLVAAAGLRCLWKARMEFSQAHAGRWLFGTALLGFGWWNITDVAAFHWILQIHRVRVDSDHRLLWDAGWLILFGLAFVFIGWRVRRHVGAGTPPGANRNAANAAIVSAVVIAAGSLAALPPRNADTSLILFRPGTTPTQVFQALATVDGRVLWADHSGSLWAVKMKDPARSAELYRHRALLVSSQLIAFGCFSWVR